VPPEAVAMALERLRAPAGPWAMIDPCAGKGAALAQLAGALGCRPGLVHGIELDSGRAEELKAALPEAQVLAPASVFGCRATWGSFSLAFMNPPFDDELADSGRTEVDFLEHVLTWLMPGGVLAFVCPESVVDSWHARARRLLLQWCDDVTVLAFPEEHRNYNEVVVLAVRQATPRQPDDARWEQIQAPEGFVSQIPEGLEPLRFAKVEPTEAEWAEMLAASPLRRHLTVASVAKVPSPPLALGAGHIALLLASGHLDGVVCPPGEPPHVVRGTARKIEYVADVKESEDAKGKTTTTTTLRERIQLVVRAVAQDGTIHTWADGEEQKGARMADNNDNEFVLGHPTVRGQNTGHRLKCDPIAVYRPSYEDGYILLLSAAGPATAVKALAAALRSNARVEFLPDMLVQGFHCYRAQRRSRGCWCR
jgi:hypothetical protein